MHYRSTPEKPTLLTLLKSRCEPNDVALPAQNGTAPYSLAISTGTMVRMGRVAGNWMSHVAVSNKKLMDRSIRLVAELCRLDYETAAREIFAAVDELERTALPGTARVSPVQHVLAKRRSAGESNVGQAFLPADAQTGMSAPLFP